MAIKLAEESFHRSLKHTGRPPKSFLCSTGYIELLNRTMTPTVLYEPGKPQLFGVPFQTKSDNKLWVAAFDDV